MTTEHEHQWKQTGADEVACRICGIEPYQLHTVDNGDPVDDLHAESIELRYAIRRRFAAARRAVATWEPEPYPNTVETAAARPSDVGVVYVDELDRPRPWFRS